MAPAEVGGPAASSDAALRPAPCRVEVCAPPYYRYTLGKWLEEVGEVLAQWGILAEASYGECGDVLLAIEGRTFVGLPDNEGTLMELLLSLCRTGGPVER